MHRKRRHHTVFYGWWIVGAGFVLALYTDGAIFYGFTAIFEPIANEFGWSYAQIAFAASLRSLVAALLVPLMGLCVDRWGPRRLVFGGAIGISLGFMLLSRTTSLGMFYGAFSLVAVGLSALSSTVLLTALANWFWRKAALAIGIISCGYGSGGLLVLVIVKLIDLYEWRMTMAILAMGMLLIGLPLSLLIRHKPEQYGYQPDGKVNSTVILDNGLVPAQTAGVDIGAMQALKSTAFWHIALAVMCQSMATGAVVVHVMPYLSSIGVVRASSSLTVSVIGLLSIVGRFGFGWLADKFDKRWLAGGGLAILSLSLLLFSYITNGGTWLLVPFVILFGTGFGGMVTVRAALLREYFGRTKFGTIHGSMMGMMALGGMVGPLLAGWVFDNWGSYRFAWLAFTCLISVALIIMVTTPSVGTSVQLANDA